MRIRSGILIACLLSALAACSDEGPPPTSSMLPDSVDQVAYGFTTYITQEGVEIARIEADSAFHYPASQEWNLYGLRVEFRTTRGVLRSTVTAREGTYLWRTGDMEARDSVVAFTPDGRQLTTCSLGYEKATDQIIGACDFVFDAPPDRHLEGESFLADPDFRDVRAVNPRRGRAGDVEVERP